MSLQQNIDYKEKISNIRARVDRAYLPEKNDSYALSTAMGDIKFLLEEIERLRADISDASKERTAVVAHLRERAIHGAGNTIMVEDACTILADLFERGEHHREEKHGH